MRADWPFPARPGAPYVCVTMAVFNGELHLRTALESILSQTFRDFELVAIDDGSTDGTAGILAEFALKDARVRVLRHRSNRGLVFTRNHALEACRSPLLAVADADDVFDASRLQKQVEFLMSHPDIGFVGSNAVLIDQDGRPLPGRQQLPSDDADIRFELLLGGCFWNTSTLYRVELMRQVGGYREGYDGVEDYDLWSRLLEVTRAANLPERLVSQRLHGGSFTAALSKVLRRQSIVAQERLQAYLERPVGSEEALSALTLFMYGWRIALGRPEAFEGLRLLREVARRADAREPPRLSRAFRHRVARAIRQQARVQAGHHRAFAVQLAGIGARWDPTIVASREFALLLATLVTPTPVIAAARRMKRILASRRP